MKTTKLFCCILLCSMVSLVACNSNDTDDSITELEELTDVGNNYFMAENGLYYRTTSSSTAEVVHDVMWAEPGEGGYNNIWSDIIIPEAVSIKGKKYRVTSIMEKAFHMCWNIQSIVIPNSVTEIGESAFDYCGLASVTLPSSVTSIQYATFQSCQLTSITIPEGVKEIGDRAFYWCADLTSVVIPSSITYIGNCAFYYDYYDSLIESFTSYIQDPRGVAEKYAFSMSSYYDYYDDDYVNSPQVQTLYVPKGTKDLYANTAPWNNLAKEIVEMSE